MFKDMFETVRIIKPNVCSPGLFSCSNIFSKTIKNDRNDNPNKIIRLGINPLFFKTLKSSIY